jgi:pyruvate kinase
MPEHKQVTHKDAKAIRNKIMSINYPLNKTKIICTIGPATNTPEMMDALLHAGMNVARLNFSHGDFGTHADHIRELKKASARTGIRLAIMADLPGPKMRIGELEEESIELVTGETFTLTTENMLGIQQRVSVSFKQLCNVVNPGDKLFLNDGLISLLVKQVSNTEVHCEVRSGGELLSRKGLNLPGIDLGFSAFTPHDRDCLQFALEHGIDAVSQSFVANKDDILDLKQAAADMGYQPFVIAKIERSEALNNLDEILDVTNGIMVARGDLGVEIPIATMAVVQKSIIQRAANKATPVITATQMLESMTEHRRPTRAEATDVANAILDGTDAVMLSAESAMGRYPVEATAMLAEIAAKTEPHRKQNREPERPDQQQKQQQVVDLIAYGLKRAVTTINPLAVIIPTRSGSMARNVTRYRLPIWITALSAKESTCQSLQFSYGVYPFKVERDVAEWTPYLREWFKQQQINEGMAVLTQGPSAEYPCGNHRIEFVDLSL